MKQLKITLNGKTVRTYRNDLHNSLSPKYHKPRQRPGYKAKYINQMSNNKGLLVALGTTMFLGTSILVGCSMRVDGYKAEINRLERLRVDELEKTEAIIVRSNEIETELASCSAKLNSKKLTGKVSFYSEKGCLGCNSGLITASGDKLVDTKRTLALPLYMKGKLPMGTMVTVKNLDNGLSTTAKFNDYGGFAKYNRIGDLSMATCDAVNCKTDKSTIEITWN